MASLGHWSWTHGPSAPRASSNGPGGERGAGAISNSEVCVVVRASRRLRAVSMEVARIATSYNAAPGIVGERKANRFLAVTLDFVVGHILH